MASIKQYRGKTWRAIVKRKGYPPQSKTFELKRDAEAWAASIEAKMGVSKFDHLQLKQAKVMTVRDVFQRHLDEVTVDYKGRNAKNMLKRIMAQAAFMNLLITKVRPSDIRDWRDDRLAGNKALKRKPIAPQSVNREFATVSGVFTHAIKEWGIPLELNPCHSVSAFKNADVERDSRWSQEDIQKLLTAIEWKEEKPLKTGRDYVGWALLLAVETAMRVGELCELRVSDFHPEEQYVHLEDTKNGDNRDVPLSTTAIRYIQILCRDKRDTDKIIAINANTMSEYFLEARIKAGLQHLVFHDSRHEAATRLSKKLSNVLELSAVTGHRSLKALKRYYNPTPAEIAGKLG
jgi:integrase